jgi:hypothetical protein
MVTLYWIREDGQGAYNMGDFDTEAAAKAEIETAEAELISQCPGPHIESNNDFTRCRDEIKSGKWSIQAK